MPTPIRRFLLWSLAAWISAAPSFVVASASFHRGAMVLGVVLYTLVLTALSCTAWFERLHRQPHFRETLYIGYGTRICISLLFPVALFFDLWTGSLSVSIVEAVVSDEKNFVGTLYITLIQGTFINLIVLVFMVMVYGIRRMGGPPPDHYVDLSTCAHCQYDLRGSRRSEVCPECGETVPWLTPRQETGS